MIGLASVGLAATMEPVPLPGLEHGATRPRHHIHVPYIVIAGAALILDAKDVLHVIFSVICAFGVTSPRYYISGVDNTLTIDRFPQPEVISLEDVRECKMMPKAHFQQLAFKYVLTSLPIASLALLSRTNLVAGLTLSTGAWLLWDLRGCLSLAIREACVPVVRLRV